MPYQALYITLTLLFIFSQYFHASAQEIVDVLDAAEKRIAYIENGKVRDAGSKEVILNVQGNLIFKGDSYNKNDILLMAKVANVYKKKPGFIYSADMQKVRFSTWNGGFYLGNSQTVDQLLAILEPGKDDNSVLIRDAQSGSVLGHITSDALSSGELVAVLYLFVNTFGIEQKVRETTPIEPEPMPDAPSGGPGSLKRMWGNATDEYSWDGYTLKRKWNPVDFEEWTFDGTTLERTWYSDRDAFVWDGKTLKRKWFTSQDEFEFNGRTVRKIWGDSSEEFILQGNIVKRMWDSSGKDEWQISGEVPIPVVILVVYGLTRK